MKVIALIVAAGRGQRTGLDLPKQYIEIAGKTVLRRSVEAFARHPGIDEVCVVINAEDEERYQETLGDMAMRSWVAGGADRQSSVANGLESLSENPPDFVLIHDAARPFVTQELITNCLDALQATEAVLPAVRSTDTLKICEGNVITSGIDRDTVVAAQTPQCFAFAPILAAHRTFAGSGATDDIALAEMAGLTVAMVAGDVENFKITTAADIDKARRRIVGALTDVRSGQGVDVHAFEAGRELWLAGIKIPHNKGLKGHSDADVALHALTDALLGALGAGDIGTHFPPSDSRWKGVASEIFLKHSASLIAAANGVISNIDLTIICEAPKISPYRQAMIARIAEILGISEARVSVKGTTTEKLGFTGRGEGIAAQAIATIRLPE